jgi:hypothetical protein
MDPKRIRISAAAIAAYAVLVGLVALPANGANGCTLTAPFAVRVGDALNITGSGFPATTTVAVSLTIDGGTPDAFTVDSNAGGDISIGLTPETADIGHTKVVATAGAVCAATVEFTVVGANATLPPEPTAPPAGGSGAGGGDTAPRTDSAPSSSEQTPWPASAWLLGVLSLLIGIGGLVATRPARGR